jgi:hypothetical protein
MIRETVTQQGCCVRASKEGFTACLTEHDACRLEIIDWA